MTPRAIVLGTAQDGGLPQTGCSCPNCRRARGRPRRARRVACLGLLSSRGERFLVDATPDLPHQLTTPPQPAGILLTHAHLGHIAGLLWLGREAMAVRGLPLWLGPRLRGFLESNEPWATLLREGYLEPRPLEDGVAQEIAPGLRVTPILVPHRAEWSETFAFRISGPKRTVLWLPDIDRFEEDFLADLLEGVHVAFLDGTFWSEDELPGRDLSEIPHPPVKETLVTLARIRPRAGIAFVHLNHTNPLWNRRSRSRRILAASLRAAGVRSPGGKPVPDEGLVVRL